MLTPPHPYRVNDSSMKHGLLQPEFTQRGTSAPDKQDNEPAVYVLALRLPMRNNSPVLRNHADFNLEDRVRFVRML